MGQGPKTVNPPFASRMPQAIKRGDLEGKSDFSPEIPLSEMGIRLTDDDSNGYCLTGKRLTSDSVPSRYTNWM
jgi:hypothetical protein